MPLSVCNTDFLISAAQNRPENKEELQRLQYFLPELLKDKQCNYIQDILALVKDSLSAPKPIIVEKNESIQTKNFNKNQIKKLSEKQTSSNMNSKEENESDDETLSTTRTLSSVFDVTLSKTMIFGIIATFMFAIGINMTRKK